MTDDVKALVDELNADADPGFCTSSTSTLSRRAAAALTAQAEEIERLRGGPSEAQIEAAARTIHGMFYGYEGANPNSDPDDEDRAIARAALKAAQEVKT